MSVHRRQCFIIDFRLRLNKDNIRILRNCRFQTHDFCISDTLDLFAQDMTAQASHNISRQCTWRIHMQIPRKTAYEQYLRVCILFGTVICIGVQPILNICTDLSCLCTVPDNFSDIFDVLQFIFYDMLL